MKRGRALFRVSFPETNSELWVSFLAFFGFLGVALNFYSQ